MRDTQRTLINIPGSMDNLTNLTELDLAQNALPKVPEALYSLRNLCRLNLSDNEITELSQAIGKCSLRMGTACGVLEAPSSGWNCDSSWLADCLP
jgi:Leucine-rich repeat (LRR) protein